MSIKPVGIGLLCYRVVALALHSRITMRRSPTRLGGPARLWCHAHASGRTEVGYSRRNRLGTSSRSVAGLSPSWERR